MIRPCREAMGRTDVARLWQESVVTIRSTARQYQCSPFDPYPTLTLEALKAKGRLRIPSLSTRRAISKFLKDGREDRQARGVPGWAGLYGVIYFLLLLYIRIDHRLLP